MWYSGSILRVLLVGIIVNGIVSLWMEPHAVEYKVGWSQAENTEKYKKVKCFSILLNFLRQKTIYSKENRGEMLLKLWNWINWFFEQQRTRNWIKIQLKSNNNNNFLTFAIFLAHERWFWIFLAHERWFWMRLVLKYTHGKSWCRLFQMILNELENILKAFLACLRCLTICIFWR